MTGRSQSAAALFKWEPNSTDDMNATLYDRMLSSVFEDGESEFKGTVSDFGLMRELIREYTHAGIAIMERRRHDMTPRYHKLQGFWCGDQSVKLFSPMDALSCQRLCVSADDADHPIFYAIEDLPENGVDWDRDSPLLYAFRERHGHITIYSLLKHRAFFAASECNEAIRAVVCDGQFGAMECFLDYIVRNCLGHFILMAVPLAMGQGSGTALHVCCSEGSVDDRLPERIDLLLRHGVDPRRLTSAGNLRAADMLAMRANGAMSGSPEEHTLIACALLLKRRGAGPVRHCLREVAKMDILPPELRSKIATHAFH